MNSDNNNNINAIQEEIKKELIELLSKKDEICCICLNPINMPITKESEPCIVSDCKHRFCKSCVYDYIMQKKTCPMCRHNVKYITHWSFHGPKALKCKRQRLIVNKLKPTIINRLQSIQRDIDQLHAYNAAILSRLRNF